MATGEIATPTGAVTVCTPFDRQVAALRPALGAADTFTATAILATPALVLGSAVAQSGGRKSIIVGGRFSNSAATVTCQIVYVYTDPSGTARIKGYSAVFTLTAGAIQFEGSYYPAPDQIFDSEGATDVRVILTGNPSAGTVSLWVGSE